jgi:hypothetical protein
MVYVVYLLHAWDRILPVLPVPVAEVNNIETHWFSFLFRIILLVLLVHAWNRDLPALPVPVAEVNNTETHCSPFFF